MHISEDYVILGTRLVLQSVRCGDPDLGIKSFGCMVKNLCICSEQAGNKSIMEYLFLNGADRTSVDLEGRSLLHYAAIFGNPELVQYFVKRGLDR